MPLDVCSLCFVKDALPFVLIPLSVTSRTGEGNHPPGSHPADQGDGSQRGAAHVHGLPSRQQRQLHAQAGSRHIRCNI